MLKFSVLISVYKNEKPEYLKESIDSIVKQTLMPNEIVIVKDGLLTKELNQIIDEYEKKYEVLFKIVSFDKNRGLGLVLRDGVLVCKYDYIARMDTDDVSKPDRFEKQIKFLEEHPEISVLGTWVKEFSEHQQAPDTITKLPCKNEEILYFSKSRNPFRHMTVIFKKQSILDSGNYRDFLWFEDYDLWVRVIKKGYKVANLPEFLVDVRADNEMFARRGGLKYLRQDITFQLMLLYCDFITSRQFLKNVVVRSVVRLMPNILRCWFYKRFLRKCDLSA